MENEVNHDENLSWEDLCFEVVKNEHKIIPIKKNNFFIEKSIKKLYSSDQTYRRHHVARLSLGFNEKYVFHNAVIFSNNKIPQCIYYRCKQKLNHFKGINKSCVYESDFLKAKELLLSTNLLIMHRCAFDDDIFSVIQVAKQNNVPIWYDIDDYIFNADHYPSAFESYCGTISIDRYQSLLRSNELYYQIIDICDGVFVSTEPLRHAVIKDFPDKDCVVYPNVLDDSFLISDISKNENLTIFYGTPTLAHKQVFYEALLPALIRVLNKYPHVKLCLIGKFETNNHPQIDCCSDFIEREKYLNLLSKCHINLSTLELNEYTHCKSEIKWLEAAQYEIPSIVPRTKTYLNLVEKINNQVLLFADTEEEYFLNLCNLIENESLRKNIGSKAKEFAQTYRSEKIGQQILKNSLRKITKKNKQKILIVNIWYGKNAAGGASKVVLNQVEYLNNKYSDYYDFQVLCSMHSKTNRSYTIEQFKENDISVTRFLLPSTPWEETEDQEVKNMCMMFYKKQDFDLIHFHCCQVLTASAVEAAIDLNIPFIITVHDAWWLTKYLFLIDDSNNVVDLNNLEEYDKIRYSKLKVYLEKAKHVFCVSDSFADLYKRKTGLNNIQSSPNGIEKFPVVERSVSGSGKIRVGMLGGQSYHKGYHLFLNTIKSNHFKNLEFYVIGEGESNNLLHFLPRVEYKDMPILYSNLDVVVVPSLWPESYCLIAKEALHCGIWVIASDLGDTSSYILEEENGNIIDANSENGLKNALLKIDENPNKVFYNNKNNIRTNFEQFEHMKEIYESITMDN
jgi:glycosyltransferase involved in cell wall biosynthesis